MDRLISKRDYLILYALLALVYLTGLYIPLMENDAAQHATMAMRMVLNDDYLNLMKWEWDYLDKPHMHYWLAALSMKIFGISHFAYRLPALLFTVLGAYSSAQLAKEFYGSRAEHIASLIFLSAQAIILANHDVRTDAVLTGATIFGLWQLVMYSNHGFLKHAVLGAIGTAIAFSSKGQLGVFFIGVCLLTHIIYAKKWKAIWNWRVPVAVLVFAVAISPVLYAYYQQFDLHPEKVVNGLTNVSGVRFILWDQSFNRLTASGFENVNNDYFFFFHTLLWAFLPWSLLAYTGMFSRIFDGFKLNKYRKKIPIELLTSLGVLIIMMVINTSKFKLPHYINSLMPILAVLIAGYLLQLKDAGHIKTLRILYWIQLSTISLVVLFLFVATFNSFGLPKMVFIIMYLIAISIFFLLFKKTEGYIKKIVVASVFLMGLANLYLNTHLYPNILKYQGGLNAVEVMKKEGIAPEDVFMFTPKKQSWSFDFYTQRLTPRVKVEDVKSTVRDGQWLLVYDRHLDILRSHGYQWNKVHEMDHYRITKIGIKFLNPQKRAEITEKAYLLQMKNEQ